MMYTVHTGIPELMPTAATAVPTKHRRGRSVSPVADTAAASAAAAAATAAVIDCELPVEVMPFIDAGVLEKTGFRLARLTRCDCTHLGTLHCCALNLSSLQY
jgi:hypothetical protein